MTQQITQQDGAIWRVVDDQSQAQQIVYVTMNGPSWLQVLMEAPPTTIVGLAAIAGVTGAMVITALLVVAAILAQFIFGVVVVAGVVALAMVAIMAMMRG